jgi:hypothetical protein
MAYQIAKVQASKPDEDALKVTLEMWVTDPTLTAPVVVYQAVSVDVLDYTDDDWVDLATQVVNSEPTLDYDAYLAALL